MVNGLPAHVLLVHAIVVLVPLSALLIVLVALWPAARDRLAPATAVLAVLTLALVPVTTEAGDWLEHRLPRTPLLRAHTHLGDYLLPWAIGLAVLALALYGRQVLTARRPAPAADRTRYPAVPARVPVGGRGLTVVLALLAVVVAVGSTITVYKIGDSGARAAWTGRFSLTALPRPPRHS